MWTEIQFLGLNWLLKDSNGGQAVDFINILVKNVVLAESPQPMSLKHHQKNNKEGNKMKNQPHR